MSLGQIFFWLHVPKLKTKNLLLSEGQILAWDSGVDIFLFIHNLRAISY
jgi:hypothetical protein